MILTPQNSLHRGAEAQFGRRKTCLSPLLRLPVFSAKRQAEIFPDALDADVASIG
jgi:hypothetical protein